MGGHEVDAALAPLAARPAAACLLSDCDGTLAPIVDDPAAAAPLPEARDALVALAADLRTVGVVSGRPAGWLHDRFGDALVLSGLYGLEEVRPGTAGRVEVLPEVVPWLGVVAAVADAADGARPAAVLVERKGLSVTLHYRADPSAAGWVDAFVERAVADTGLEPHAAKMSVELRPPVPVDKGTAVARLAAGCSAVAYLGDDLGDLPAFAALDELRAGGADVAKVVVASAELHPAVLAAADVVVDGPAAVAAALSRLGAALR